MFFFPRIIAMIFSFCFWWSFCCVWQHFTGYKVEVVLLWIVSWFLWLVFYIVGMILWIYILFLWEHRLSRKPCFVCVTEQHYVSIFYLCFLMYRILKFQDSQLRMRINTKPNVNQKWSGDSEKWKKFLNSHHHFWYTEITGFWNFRIFNCACV